MKNSYPKTGVVDKQTQQYKLGLSKFTTYAARHSFATTLRNDGPPIEIIQESLGDDDPTTTQNYLANFLDEMKKKWAETLTKFKRA